MKPNQNRFLFSALLLGLAPVVCAQSLYWNPTPLDNTWDTASTHWTETSGGTPALPWSAGATAIFDQAGTYTVTISGTQSASTCQFSNGVVTLNLGGNAQTFADLAITAPTANTTANLTNGSLTLDGASNMVISPGVTTGGRTALIDASGLSSLTISKAANSITVGGQAGATNPGNYGTFRLSATNNSITATNVNVGTTGGANAANVINRGEVFLGTANTIHANTWKLGTTRDGGLVEFQTGLTNPSVTLRGQNGTDAVTSILVGENAAGGTPVGVSHMNFAAGSVDILCTTLTLSRGASGSTTALTPAVNGSFSMGGGSLTATNLWMSRNEGGGLNSTNSSTFTQGGGTVNANTITMGQTIAAGAVLPTFNAQYNLNAGTLKAGSVTAGTGVFATASTRRINFNGGTITHYDAATDLLINGVAGTGGSIGIALGTAGSPTILTDDSRTITLGSFTSISGNGTLSKTGSGQLVMNNAVNTAGGGQFRPYAGSVTVGATNALAGLVLVLDAADSSTVSFNGTTVVAIGGLEGSRSLSVLNNLSATQDLTLGSAGSGDYVGEITGAKSIRKVGAGTQTYDPGSLHAASLTGLNVSGGTLELKSGNFTITGSAPTGSPDSTNGFIVSRGGTFRMNGANVTATGGSYVITAGNTLGGSNNFILDSGTFDGGIREVLNAYGAAGTFTINDGLFVCGEFRVSQSATGTVNLNGGTLRVANLKHANSTAIVNFNGGTLQAKANRADFITSGVTEANVKAAGAVIDSNGFNITIQKPLLEAPDSTGGGLDKDGDGALTLAEANTYKGPTEVNDGTLLLNGDNSAATGAITVNNEGVLGGTGILGGAVTVTTDAKLAPGTSAGTLTTSANVGGAGTLEVELDGTAADKLVLTGSGTIDISGLKLNITELAGGATEPVYVIVDSAAAITGAAFAAVTGVPSGYTLTYNYNDGVDSNNIALVATGGSPFTTWATTTNGLAGGDAAPGADPDNDGLDNAIEFVIGGQPNPANPNAASNAIAPTATASGANLLFTFRRTDLSLTQPGIAINVEYGSDLIGWTPAQDGVNGVTVTPTNDVPEPGIDTVVVSIPKALATGEKLFARLKVAIP